MAFSDTIQLKSVQAFPVRATGGISPKMALGTMETRPALLLRVEDTNGCFGWGEVWANFPPRANQHKAQLIEDVVTKHLIELSFCEPKEVTDALRDRLSVYFLHVGQSQVFEHILAGLDTALWDLALRNAGLSFAEFFDLNQARAQTYATSINVEDLDRLIPHHAGLGQTGFKLKIGFAAHNQQQLMLTAQELLPKGSHLMVDSNQSWNLGEAQEALSALDAFDLFFAEEPLRADASKREWEALANSSKVPLAGGENIYGLEAFMEFANAGLKVLQPDVAKWGGVTGALELAEVVTDDILIWPHFMGTAVGQQAALCVSAAISEKNKAAVGTLASCCEVDVNANALRSELCGDVLAIQAGHISLPKTPGLVVPPTSEGFSKFLEG